MHVASKERESSLDICQYTHTANIPSVPRDQFPGKDSKFLPTSSLFEEMLNLPHERQIGWISRDPEGGTDGLFVVAVAQLDDTSRIYVVCCLVDVLVVITDHRSQRIQQELERLKEGKTRCVVFRNREDIRGNIMGQVVNAVENRDLAIIAFDLDVLAIHEEYPAEARTVLPRDVCTVG